MGRRKDKVEGKETMENKNNLCHCCEREIKDITVGDLGVYCSDGCLEEYEFDSFFDGCDSDY